MPNCRVCGVDIPEPGLCAECQAEQSASAAKRRAGPLPLIIALALGVVLITATAIIISLPQGETTTAGTGDESQPVKMQGTRTAADRDNESMEKFGNQTVPVKYDITKITDQPPIDNQDGYIKWMLAHTNESEASLSLRWERAQLIIQSGQGEFADPNALRAFLLTPRERFTRGQNLFATYGAKPLQIGYGQTITAPNVMAMMTTSLRVKPEDKILEIGTGSGYQSAVLARLSNHVYSIEIIKELYQQTDKLFTSLEKEYPVYKNIVRKLDDGYYGWAKYAPFDKIIITCSIDHLPPPLIKQLKVGGIIIVPLGPPYRQFLMRIEKVKNKDGQIRLIQKDVYDGMGVIFVPFTDSKGKSYSK
ncbi:MAG: protein-L-isoaspartate O-methyltransferase [Spirochaetia bacterium]